ncbi:MAG TPA: alpha/beta hydrolase, partial [Kofleriaceae bacterium]|nr:alpha/beta hydrolase [Kofleriaceae bacterium]
MSDEIRSRVGFAWITLAFVAAGAGCAPAVEGDGEGGGEGGGEASAALSGAVAQEEPAQVAAAKGEAPLELADRRAGAVQWSPCEEDPELSCGTLLVPADPRRPGGERLSLAVIKAPALGARKRGSVFVNPGGPGGSGVDLVLLAKSMFAELRRDFDIVSFDPRGTGRSHALSCEVVLPPQPSDSLESQAAFNDETGRRIAQSCRAQHGELPALMVTSNVARDLDLFRAALGESTINYLGYSYGTALGATYATLFPSRVRAMVLDGNVPPQWFGDYLLELDAEGSAGAELALQSLDQRCRADAACPLRAAGVVATFDRVVARLDANPVAVEGGIIDGSVIRGGLFSALYAESIWPLIVEVLALADAGNYEVFAPISPTPPTSITVPGGVAVVCGDSRTRRPGLDYLPQQMAAKQLYPRFGGANFGDGIGACSAWPLTDLTPLVNAQTRNPIVLIGNDYDPATPLPWSRNMAAVLRPRARLLRYQGGGHTIYGSGSACIDGAVNHY